MTSRPRFFVSTSALILAFSLLFCILSKNVEAQKQLLHPNANNAQGQEDTEPSSKKDGEDEASTPVSVAELVPRATKLSEQFTALTSTLDDVLEGSVVREKLEERQDLLNRLAAEFRYLKLVEAYGFDQIAELRTRVRAEAATVSALTEEASEAARELSELQEYWSRQKEQWKKWKENLPEDAPQDTVAEVFSETEKTISDALSRISQKMKPILELQRRGGEVQNKAQALDAEIQAVLGELRGKLISKTAPSMFSGRFYREVISSISDPGKPGGLQKIPWPEKEFFVAHGWLIALQIIVFLLISVGIVRQRKVVEGEERWRFIRRRPLATGLLVSVAVLSPLYDTLPPIGNLLMWTAGVFASSRLFSGAVEVRWKRAMIFILAVLFIVTQGIRVLGVPLPLIRLYVVAVTLTGTILCWRGAVVITRKGVPASYAWTLQGGSIMSAVILFTQIGGFSTLSIYLLESSLKTVFLLLGVWLLTLLLKGGTAYGIQHRFAQKLLVIRINTPQIMRRANFFINFAVGVFIFGLLLGVWRVYGSVWEAIAGSLSLSFSVGQWEISVGLVLGALTAIYGAYLMSLIIQAVLFDEIYPRRHVAVGARHSMNRLIHYTMLLIGFLVALSLLGVEFRNITILIGAFSVGIGFGLQNIFNNFVSGLILLFEQPVKVGDIVFLGGEWGTIRKLGLRATVVKAFAGSELIVPNSELISNQVINWTFSDRTIRVIVKVGVAYGSDVPLVMNILREIADEHPLVVKDPEPLVLFRQFGESSLNFELWVNITDLDQRLVTESELHQAVEQKFREAGVQIPFPQSDIHIKDPIPSSETASQENGSKELPGGVAHPDTAEP